MMACTNCGGRAAAGCQCYVQAGANVTVTGTGSSGDPYVVAADGGGAGGSVDVVSSDGTVLVEESSSGGVTTFDLAVRPLQFYTGFGRSEGAGGSDPGFEAPLGWEGTLTADQVRDSAVLITWDPTTFLDSVVGGVYNVVVEVQFGLMPVVSAQEAEPLLARVRHSGLIPAADFRQQPLPFIVEGAIAPMSGPMIQDIVFGRCPVGSSLSPWEFSVGYRAPGGVTSTLDFVLNFVVVKGVRVADLP
jgi:hypothetical protein